MAHKILLFVLIFVIWNTQGQLLRPELMDLGVYNPETKKYEKDDEDITSSKKVILGGDDHDLKPHKKFLLGGDDHDLKPHKKSLLGEDDHDFKLHKKSLLGGDDHDFKSHKKHLLGGDDHDRKVHHMPLIGGGDHDMKHHKKPVFGGDDHDFKPHKKPLLGGDDHDFKLHKKPVFGGDDHDFKPHKKPVFGGDDHDFKPHKKPVFGGDDHDFKPHKKRVFGGDDHDFKPHKKFLGKNLPARPHLVSFQEFVETHNRVYSTKKEFLKRFQVFRGNLRKIRLLQQNELGTAKYGVNKFADYTSSEFRVLLGLRPELKPAVSKMLPAEIPSDINIPVEFDWRKRNVVTEVKNQGMCGSCWAFSVTGNVEGQWAIKHKKLYSLSEQELVDCDDTDEGCNGGLPENAYKAIQDLGGLETENGYPYEGKDEKCHLEAQKIKVHVNGSVELPEDEEMMAQWLVKNGPISIGINANALQFYVGGVSHPFKFLCNPESLDHGMLIVGYGVHTTKYLHRRQPYWLVKNSWGKDWGEEKSLPFWIVKNSWGEHWGEQGYYRVYRGDGTCGVNKMATSAIVP